MGPILGLVMFGLLVLFFRMSTDSWKYAFLIALGIIVVGAALDQAGFHSSGADWCDENNCH
jgi:hypothetical protein